MTTVNDESAQEAGAAPDAEMVTRLLQEQAPRLAGLTGDMPVDLDGTQQVELAETLGRFVRSLHAVDATGLPVGPEHWGYRSGEPATPTIDAWADGAAELLADLYDPGQVRAA